MVENVFIIHCVDYPERLSNIKSEMTKLGIDNYNIVYTVKNSINEMIISKLTDTNIYTTYYNAVFGQKNYKRYSAVFDCAYNFYKIVKSAYVMGLNEILLLEDDFNTNISKEEFHNILSNLPKDYNCVKLSYFVSTGNWDAYHKTMKKISDSKDDFIKLDKSDFVNTNTCFVLNRKGMEYYINFMEKNFCPADVPFVHIEDPKLNVYVYKKNICSGSKLKSTLI